MEHDGDVKTLNGSLKEVYLIVLNKPGIKTKQVAELRKKSESTVGKQLAESFWRPAFIGRPLVF